MRYLTKALLSLLEAAPCFAESAEDEAEGFFTDFDHLVNHYKCYMVDTLDMQPPPEVLLSDQFKQSAPQVVRPQYLCNPVKKTTKNHQAPIVHEDIHYVCFVIKQAIVPHLPDVFTSNQFGIQKLSPIKSELLCLPSKKVHA